MITCRHFHEELTSQFRDATVRNVPEFIHPFTRAWHEEHVNKVFINTIRQVAVKNIFCRVATNTGLFEMIVGVLTTCHTQYT